MRSCTTGPLRAISVDAYSREHTSVGNVLFSPYLASYAGKTGVLVNGRQTRSDTNDVYMLGNFAWDQVTGNAPNFGDCNGNPGDGCETDLATAATCGPCVSDGQCPSGFFCNGTQCTKKQAAGAVCNRTEECGSGFCVNGDHCK